MAKISDFVGSNSNNNGERVQAKFWINWLTKNQNGEFVSQSFLTGTPCNDWNAVVKVANKFPMLAAAMRQKSLSAQKELAAGETLRFKVSELLGMELRAVGAEAEQTLNAAEVEVELL